MSRAALVLMALTMALSACRVHDARINPPPPLEVPETYRHPAGDAPASVRWWEDFEDESLNATIDQALSGNMDLRAAWARLAQAAAIARQQASAMMPQVEAGMGVARQRIHTQQLDTSSIDASGGLDDLSIQTKSVAREVDNFQVNVSVGWEIDLWGRVASLEDASLKDRLAGREDLSAIAVVVAAQVAETWFMLAEQDQLAALLERQLATNRALLELVELRFTQGLAHAVDVRQQRQQLSAVEAEVPLVKARKEVLRSQLAVLVGVPPQRDLPLPSGPLMSPPPVPDTGLPLDILVQRPDVRAARLRVTAADHRVGAAIADQLPALRFSGGTGFADAAIDVLFMRWIYNLAANLIAPLFDGGRRSAEVDRAQAVVEERLYGFGQVVLRALKEVDDALALEARQVEHLEALSRSVAQARETLSDVRGRYASGLTDYLPVLSAVKTLQAAERREVSGLRQRLSYRVQLHRALGGAWARQLPRPPAPDSVQVEEP